MASTRLWDPKTHLSIGVQTADQPGDHPDHDEVNWVPLEIYQRSMNRSGNTTYLIGYIESLPNHAFTFTVSSRKTARSKPSQWTLKRDQLFCVSYDRVDDAVLEMDVPGNNAVPELTVGGVFDTADTATFAAFCFRSRGDGEPLPSTSKLTLEDIEDMSALTISFHHCTITKKLESRPNDVGEINEEEKEVIRSRSAHPRLSEYLDLGEARPTKPVDFGGFSDNKEVPVISKMAENPHLVFKFRYKSKALLEELSIKTPPVAKKAVRKRRLAQPEQQPVWSPEDGFNRPASRQQSASASRSRPSAAVVQLKQSRSPSPAAVLVPPDDLEHGARSSGRSFGVRVKMEDNAVKQEKPDLQTARSRPSHSGSTSSVTLVLSEEEELAESSAPSPKVRKLAYRDHPRRKATTLTAAHTSDSAFQPLPSLSATTSSVDPIELRKQRALSMLAGAGAVSGNSDVDDVNVAALLKAGFTMSSTFARALKVQDSQLERALKRSGMELPEIILLQSWAASQS